MLYAKVRSYVACILAIIEDQGAEAPYRRSVRDSSPLLSKAMRPAPQYLTSHNFTMPLTILEEIMALQEFVTLFPSLSG